MRVVEIGLICAVTWGVTNNGASARIIISVESVATLIFIFSKFVT